MRNNQKDFIEIDMLQEKKSYLTLKILVMMYEILK